MFRLSRISQPNAYTKAFTCFPKPLPRVQPPVRQFSMFHKNMSMSIPIGTSKVLPLLFLSASTVSLYPKKSVYCEAGYKIPQDLTANKEKPILNKGELSFGTFLGLCTGFLVKKVGKLFAAFVGTVFVAIQYLSSEGYISVNWDRFEKRYIHVLDTDKDGKVSTKDLQSKWRKFINILTSNLQFKSTFLAGFYIGLRYG